MVRRGLLKHIESIIAVHTSILQLLLGNSAKALRSSFMNLLEMMTFRDRTRVLKVELPRVLLVKIGHQNFKSFIILPAAQCIFGVWNIQVFGVGCLAVWRGWRCHFSVWLRNVEVPMLSVHLANHVGTPAKEDLVEKPNFVAPATVWSALLIWIKEVLTAVKDAVRSSCDRDAP